MLLLLQQTTECQFNRTLTQTREDFVLIRKISQNRNVPFISQCFI